MEALSDSISYSFVYDAHEKAAHARVGDSFNKLIATPVLNLLSKDSEQRKPAKAVETASASFRYALRSILLKLLGSVSKPTLHT